jgi:hypothetical protein
MGKTSLLLRDDVAPKFLVLVLSMLSQRSQGSYVPEKVASQPPTIFFLFDGLDLTHWLFGCPTQDVVNV